MTNTVYVDAITGAAVVAIAALLMILVVYCVGRDYRFKQQQMQHDERQKELAREHELLKLDATRQVHEIERDREKIQADLWDKKNPDFGHPSI